MRRWVGIITLVAVGCQTSMPTSYRRMESAPRDVSSGTDMPEWVFASATPSKVAELERWLASSDSRNDFWRLEAELQLAETRLELLRTGLLEDPGGRATEASAVAVEAAAANAGFQRVLADARASSLQTRRATSGIETSNLLGEFSGEPASAVAVPRGILPRQTWGARSARPTRMTASRNHWTRLTVHHSAEAAARPLDGSLANSAAAVRRIQHVHMSGANTGYGDIGYHFLIDPAGRVFEGRTLEWQGAHSSGANNRRNIGICLLGNFEGHRPTPQALGALDALMETLRRNYGVPRSQVFGHQELKNTLCPGKHLMAWVESYRRGSSSPRAQRSAPPGAVPANASRRRATVLR